MTEYYYAGRAGIDFESVRVTGAKYLTQAARQAAYRAGEIDEDRTIAEAMKQQNKRSKRSCI